MASIPPGQGHRLDRTLDLTGNVLEPSSPLQYTLTRTTAELEETARSIRALVELLQRQPSGTNSRRYVQPLPVL